MARPPQSQAELLRELDGLSLPRAAPAAKATATAEKPAAGTRTRGRQDGAAALKAKGKAKAKAAAPSPSAVQVSAPLAAETPVDPARAELSHVELLDELSSFCLPGTEPRAEPPATPEAAARRPRRRQDDGGGAAAAAEAGSAAKKRPRKTDAEGWPQAAFAAAAEQQRLTAAALGGAESAGLPCMPEALCMPGAASASAPEEASGEAQRGVGPKAPRRRPKALPAPPRPPLLEAVPEPTSNPEEPLVNIESFSADTASEPCAHTLGEAPQLPAASAEEAPLDQRAKEEKASAKRYRQAHEEAGSGGSVVEVLCFDCRRTKDTTVQKSLWSFFKVKQPTAETESCADPAATATEPPEKNQPTGGAPLCAKCRRPMWIKGDSFTQGGATNSLRGFGEMPQLQRIRSYKRSAEKEGVPYLLSERGACTLMRMDCVTCGAAAPAGGHGLARLRKWPEGTEKPEKGGFMGPYMEENVVAACSMCNMMKGYHTVRGFVNRCQHIASMHTPGEHFGEYPLLFRDNVWKRSRSSYITCSTTHTKTHSITNEEFNRITAQQCYYCHKVPRQPTTLGPDDRGHFNGLDRLDSTHRVYTVDTTVACCGDCNVMKFKWPVDRFLAQCRKVARLHVGHEFEDTEQGGTMEAMDSDSENVADTAEVACDAVDDVDQSVALGIAKVEDAEGLYTTVRQA